MKLYLDLRSKLNRLRVYACSSILLINIFYFAMFLSDLHNPLYYGVLVIISIILMYGFYLLNVVLVKHSYHGKILKIKKINVKKKEDSRYIRRNKNKHLYKKSLMFNKQKLFMQFFSNTDEMVTPQKYMILKIYENFAFIEQVVTKRKHMVDLRFIRG